MKTTEMLAIMYNMQDGFNKVVHPQWETQNFSQKTAIITEAVEAMDSFAWPWWKTRKDDYQNYIVELVDIWHFVMSWDQQNTLTNFKAEASSWNLDTDNRDWREYVSDIYDDTFTYDQTKTKRTKEAAFEALDDIIKMVYSVVDGHRDTCDLADALLNGWIHTVGDISLLYKYYIGKNALNLLRQRHGYKDGSYVKIWQGEEDNVHMMKIVEELETSNTLFEEVYNRMEQIYPK